MMEEEKFEIQAMDFMSGNMSDVEAKNFERFLKEHMEYREKYEDLLKAWELMEAMQTPEPSTQMDQAFFTMLSNEMGKEKGSSPKQNLIAMFTAIFRPQWAIGVLLLLIGLGIGYFLRPEGETIPAQTMAFACSSSAATLPMTMKCVKSTGRVPTSVASFVLPLGATVNMDGTTIYFTCTCIW